MKNIIKKTAVKAALLAVAGVASSASAQLTDYTAGDIVIGFHQTGNNTTFVYNIGYSVDFRDNENIGSLGNIGSFLTTAFGSNWATSGDVYWSAVGMRANGHPFFVPTVDGDPATTTYISKAATGVQTSTPWSLGQSDLTSSSVQVLGALTGTNGGFSKSTAAAGSAGKGAFVDTSTANDWANYNPVGGAAFGGFTGGAQTVLSSGTAYLDLYRVLAYTDGANPTGTIGQGTWETTLVLDSSGNLSAIPEPSTYAGIFGVAVLLLAAVRRIRRKA